ncbi:MAG: hypothetical protein IT165_33600 [Bryobacterales bacterium]|nr:hypothetical protein [Bryobacterales bacterium]
MDIVHRREDEQHADMKVKGAQRIQLGAHQLDGHERIVAWKILLLERQMGIEVPEQGLGLKEDRFLVVAIERLRVAGEAQEFVQRLNAQIRQVQTIFVPFEKLSGKSNEFARVINYRGVRHLFSQEGFSISQPAAFAILAEV